MKGIVLQSKTHTMTMTQVGVCYNYSNI